MSAWLARRLAVSLLLVFVVTSTVFFLVRLAPGDPLHRMVDESLTDADRDLVRSRLGLDRPLAIQYLDWLGGIVRGDLGTSVKQHRPVADIVGEAVGPTLLLTTTAYVLHLLLAFGVGVTVAARRGTAWDHGLQTMGLVLYSLPSFWFGLMLIMLFARKLGWFPVGGMHAPDAEFLGPGARAVDVVHHLALPALTLGLGSFMGMARYLRARLDEILAEEHVLVARSRGIPEGRILWRHAVREALLPVITLVGLHLPFLIGGAVVVEVVFGWPGMGRVAVEALWARDYPVIVATTWIGACAVVLGSLLADIAYRWADPRLRHPGQGGP
ncbi:MAG: ABC transporter permease [bacterium]|nr:ABC transporter permease [bacterium]